MYSIYISTGNYSNGRILPFYIRTIYLAGELPVIHASSSSSSAFSFFFSFFSFFFVLFFVFFFSSRGEVRLLWLLPFYAYISLESNPS